MAMRQRVCLAALMLSAGCSHGMQVLSPSQDSLQRDDEVLFNWEDECKAVEWEKYVLQIGGDPEFSSGKSFGTDKPKAYIDLSRHFRIEGSTRVYWRVKASSDPFFRSGWSKTYSFIYRPSVREVRPTRVIERDEKPAPPPPPREVEAPASLLYGTARVVDVKRTYSLKTEGVGSVAAHYFTWRLWDLAKVRFMERDNVARRPVEDPTLLPPPTLYEFDKDKLGEIQSPESLIKWPTPVVYLVANYYRSDRQHSLFARLVDVKSGVVIWQHQEGLQAEMKTLDAFAQLLGATRAQLLSVLAADRPVTVAGVYENDRRNDTLTDLTEQLLLRGSGLTLLLRDPPVSRTLTADPREDGDPERTRTLYKLYEKQFSNIVRDGRQVWPEADEHIQLKATRIDGALPQELLLDPGISEEQLDKFWESPRTALTATFIETSTGKLLGSMTLVARDEVPQATLTSWLAPRLVR